MSNPYRYPERGHVYRRCVMCGRPFRVCNSQLARRSARFCTVRCYHAALRAFTEALASDRLEIIFRESAAERKGYSGEAWGEKHENYNCPVALLRRSRRC